jgi:hypothetical protein
MTHPGSPGLAPDPETVRRLVEEVIRRLGGVAPPSPTSPRPALEPTVVAAGASPAPAGSLPLAERVITAAVIDALPPGTTQAAVAAGAVVTPSARDRAQAAGIALVRAPAAGGDGAAATARPFVVAQAACTPAPTARTAAIARTVPGVQQLPASGLADVVASLAVHLVRDGGRGVLLTGRPATALVLANRQTGLRAVGGHDMRAVLAAAAECAANLLVIDPAAFPAGLERLCAAFAGGPPLPAPAELAAAGVHAGCGCAHGGPR